ncbi:MAG TPA: galactokinase family protein [Bacteroidota bacterium]|nr:galactokinase family protein [Bacteroidota bacterium]
MTIAKSRSQFNENQLIFDHLQGIYGGGTTLQGRVQRIDELREQFEGIYGQGPISILRAPARINLIGEHVDYVSYLPTASLTFGSREHDMLFLFRASDSRLVRGSTTLPGCSPFSHPLPGGSLSAGVNGQAWERYLYSHDAPEPHWGNYTRGAIYFSCFKYGDRISRGIDFLIDSSIPPAGGASSSSALTLLSVAALLHANRIPSDPLELARDAARAEWYVGTRGGAMDHLTISLSRRGSVVNIVYAWSSPRIVPLPHDDLRVVTIFTHPADKGRAIMLEYNERAAVSRILIPAILGVAEGSPVTPEEAGQLIDYLPEQITLARVEKAYPEAYISCAKAFPALVAARRDSPLKIRARALHHLGEVRRVEAARFVLERISLGEDEWATTDRETDSNSAGVSRWFGTRAARTKRREDGRGGEDWLAQIGRLLNDSHKSLRDLYDVSTPEVEEAVDLVLSDPQVYGARLMGGGFGGNVLALTSSAHAPALIEKVERGFYEPRGRRGASEGAVMLSTPGFGLSGLDVNAAARAAIESFNQSGSAGRRQKIHAILDGIRPDRTEEVWPVIVAAGRGERARSSGLNVPKPLAEVLGKPSVLRVLEALRGAGLPMRPPVVVVSPETNAPLRQALRRETASFVLQPAALGTGDAVYYARRIMQDFRGTALIVWATQPVLSTATVRRTLVLSALFREFEMIVPTALMERPYAPLERDETGRVTAARETHLEQTPVGEFGESNVGLFLVRAEVLFQELESLHRESWNESALRYERPRGELGFPNEMIRRLAGRLGGVFACPIADGREEKGIKTKADVELCEQYIREIEQEGREAHE